MAYEDGVTRAYNEDLGGNQGGQIGPSGDGGFWLRYLQNPAAYGATPKVANVPDFNTWAAQNSDRENTASDYVNTFYNVPLHQRHGLDKFLSNMPVYMGAAALGAGAYAGLSAGGSLAGGAAGAGEGALAGGAFDMGGVGALGSADAAAAGLGGITAPAAGGALSGAGAEGAANYAPVSDLAGGSSVPVTDLSPVASGGLPPPSAGTGAGLGGNVGTAAQTVGGSALTRLMNGTATDADWANLASGALQAGLGYASSNQQSNTLQGIYDQQRADRAPALAAYNAALSNPDQFYNSAPAMGATDAVLRKLSMQGNPANNPGLLSQAAAYNLGGYNNHLNSLSGAAFGGQGTQAQLGTAMAGAQGGGYEALGAGIRTAFPQSNPYEDYIRMMQSQGQRTTFGQV